MTYEFLETLYNDLLLILDQFVVKRYDLAKEYETTDTALAFELYYACLTGSRYFNNFTRFDIDILEKYLHPAIVSECYYTPSKIPTEYRDAIVEEQSQRVIDTYEEQNSYYRMLAGLPNLDDNQWIYIDDFTGVPNDVPIHQLTPEQIAHLEIEGKLDEIKAQYPDKEYLNYLGVHSIDIITSRLARPFEILRMGAPTVDESQVAFEKEYYMARRYVMGVIYNRRKFTNRTLYDPIIGLMMLTLAVRNTLVPDEARYLNYEEILNAILESYGLLRYFENLPFTFKRRLVLALDNILSVKGTDGVLVDICRIFSMDNFIANRYYLMKTQPKDVDGNVIFSSDPEKAYELNFVKAAISDHEISYSEDNITPYEQIVQNDYLWQLTEEEKRQILQEDFNIMMTKYIDIEAAYDLSSLTFEVCYFINLLFQSRPNELKITCTNKYAVAGYSPVYNMIVFLLATLAKRSGFDGNIVYEPAHVAEILRFNYGDIFEELQAIIDKYELQIDVNDHLLEDYHPIQLDKPVGLRTSYQMIETYVYNRELYNAILQEMYTTNDIRKYTALANAKECMYISAMEHQDFTKSDGTYANTYYEMLEDVDPVLAHKLDQIDRVKDSNDLDRMLLYILEELEKTFDSDELKYLFLNTPNTYGNLITKYLRTAINVFKASSVQLESINIFFNIGDADPIRVIDKKVLHKTHDIHDHVYVTDEVSVHKTIYVNDTVAALEKPYVNE